MSTTDNDPPAPTIPDTMIPANVPKRVILPIREATQKIHQTSDKNDTPVGTPIQAKRQQRTMLPIREARAQNHQISHANSKPTPTPPTNNPIENRDTHKRKAESSKATLCIGVPDASEMGFENALEEFERSRVAFAKRQEEFEQSRAALAKSQEELARRFATLRNLNNGAVVQLNLDIVKPADRDDTGLSGNFTHAADRAQETSEAFATNSSPITDGPNGNSSEGHTPPPTFPNFPVLSDIAIAEQLKAGRAIPERQPASTEASETATLEGMEHASRDNIKQSKEKPKATGSKTKRNTKKSSFAPKWPFYRTLIPLVRAPVIQLPWPFPNNFIKNREQPWRKELKAARFRSLNEYKKCWWQQHMWQGLVIGTIGEEVGACRRCVELGEHTVMEKCMKMKVDGNWVDGCNNCYFDGVDKHCCE